MEPIRLTDLRTRILFYAHLDGTHELDPAESNATTGQANLDYVINQAKDSLIAELPVDWKFREGVTIATIAGKRAYDLKEYGLGGVLHMINAYTKDPDRALAGMDLGDFRRIQPDETATANGDPTHYTISGREIIYWPTPSGGQTIYHDFEGQFIDLKDDSDTVVDIGIPYGVASLFEKALIHTAALEIADYDENSNKMSRQNRLLAHAKAILLKSSKPVRKKFQMSKAFRRSVLSGPHLPPEYGSRNSI